MFALSFEVSKKFIIFAPEHCFFVALRNYALCHKQPWAQGDSATFEGKTIEAYAFYSKRLLSLAAK